MAANLVMPTGIIIFIFLIWIFKCLNIMREYERAVVFRLGRVLNTIRGRASSSSCGRSTRL
jgi:regulator of protease activity HflC (stomatin/prohibitin superfamily)